MSMCFCSAQLEGLLSDVQSRVQMSMCFSSAQLEGLLADFQSHVQMSLFFVVLSLRVCWQMFRAMFRCLCFL